MKVNLDIYEGINRKERVETATVELLGEILEKLTALEERTRPVIATMSIQENDIKPKKTIRKEKVPKKVEVK